MGSRIALLLGCWMAAGAALAQQAGPPQDDLRWRLEAAPQQRLLLPADTVGVDGARSRRALSQGTLLQGRLSDDTSVLLRLRRGTLGLYLRIEFSGHD